MAIRFLKRAPARSVYPDDNSLITGIANNERKALDQIYQQSFGQIKQFITQNNGSEQDAEDIFQEGMLAVWKNIKTGKYENQQNVKLSTYLFQVCKYRWFEHLKSAKVKYGARLNPEFDIADENEMAQLQEEEERASYLRSLFEKLGDKCQQILNLYYYKKLSLAEIAQKMDYTPQSAKNEKYRCMQRLKKLHQD